MNKWIHSLTRSYNNVSAAATHPLAAMSGNKGHESVSYALVALRFAFLLLRAFLAPDFLPTHKRLESTTLHIAPVAIHAAHFSTLFLVFY